MLLVLLAIILPLGQVVAQAPPVAPQEAGPDGGLVHIVQYGDTLEAIMGAYATYGVTMDKLKELNGWRFPPQFIFVGDPIVILPPGSTTPGNGVPAGDYMAGAVAPVQPSQPPAQTDGVGGTGSTTAPVTTAPSTGTVPVVNAATISGIAPVEPLAAFLPVVGEAVPAAPSGGTSAGASTTTQQPTQATPIPAPTVNFTPQAPVPAATEEVSEAPPPTDEGLAAAVTEESSPGGDSLSSGEPLETEQAAPEVAAATEEAQATPTVTATSTTTEVPSQTPTPTTTAEPTLTESAVEVAAAQPTQAASSTPEPTSTISEPTEQPQVTQEVAENVPDLTTTQGTICVIVFDDANQNLRQEVEEALLPGGQITISGGEAQTTLADAPLCIPGIETGTQTVEVMPPGGYGITTAPSLQVEVAAGRTSQVSFGAAEGFVPPALPADQPTVTPAGSQQVTQKTVEEDNSLLDTLTDNSAYIALALAGLVFVAGGLLALLIRFWR